MTIFLREKELLFPIILCRTAVPVLGAARVFQGGPGHHDGHVTVEKSNLPPNWHKQRLWNGRALRSVRLLGGRSQVGRE